MRAAGWAAPPERPSLKRLPSSQSSDAMSAAAAVHGDKDMALSHCDDDSGRWTRGAAGSGSACAADDDDAHGRRCREREEAERQCVSLSVYKKP